MIINFKSALAFHAANVCRSNADFQQVLRYIRVSPDGRVSGSDGFRVADHREGVTPFEFDKDIFVRPTAKVTPRATGISLEWDGESTTGVLSFTVGRKQAIVACDIMTGESFPDVDRILPTAAKPHPHSAFGLNAKMLYELAQVINPGSHQIWWQTTPTPSSLSVGVIKITVTNDPQLVVLMAPLRIDGAEGTLPEA